MAAPAVVPVHVDLPWENGTAQYDLNRLMKAFHGLPFGIVKKVLEEKRFSDHRFTYTGLVNCPVRRLSHACGDVLIDGIPLLIVAFVAYRLEFINWDGGLFGADGWQSRVEGKYPSAQLDPAPQEHWWRDNPVYELNAGERQQLMNASANIRRMTTLNGVAFEAI